MAADLDIEVPRNGDYFAGWTMRDRLTNEVIDLADWVLELKVRAVAGQGAVLASASFPTRDDALGYFDIRIRGSDFEAVPGPSEIVRLAYDFRATDPTGVRVIETRGQIILIPGATP